MTRKKAELGGSFKAGRWTLQVMVVMSGVQYAPAAYGSYQFESWVQGTGFGIAALPVACILLGFLIQALRYKVGWHFPSR